MSIACCLVRIKSNSIYANFFSYNCADVKLFPVSILPILYSVTCVLLWIISISWSFYCILASSYSMTISCSFSGNDALRCMSNLMRFYNSKLHPEAIFLWQFIYLSRITSWSDGYNSNWLPAEFAVLYCYFILKSTTLTLFLRQYCSR